MIDQHKALILWNENAAGHVSRLKVFDMDELPPEERLFDNSRGASDGDWLNAPDATPAGIFLMLSLTGFESPMMREAALTEFSKIRGYIQPALS